MAALLLRHTLPLLHPVQQVLKVLIRVGLLLVAPSGADAASAGFAERVLVVPIGTALAVGSSLKLSNELLVVQVSLPNLSERIWQQLYPWDVLRLDLVLLTQLLLTVGRGGVVLGTDWLGRRM